MKQLSIAFAALATSLFVFSGGAQAQVVAPDGYIFTTRVLGDLTQSCLQPAPSGLFVGVGPGFTGNGQSVVLATESGSEFVVATGFNSIGDCVYDAANDVLYVTDNAAEAAGSVTGDTVFSIASASTAPGLPAAGQELAPAGSIAQAQSVIIDALGRLLVGDATGAGAGSIFDATSGAPVPHIAAAFDFTGGLAGDAAGNLYVSQNLATFESDLSVYDGTGTFTNQLVAPSFSLGSYDLAFSRDGRLLATGAFGGDVLSIDVVTGAIEPFVSGLTFATGISVAPVSGRVELLSSTFAGLPEDSTVHRFTPRANLFTGKGPDKKNCLSEIYGIELAPIKPGKPAKHAVCVDGEACDADGVANGTCRFPVGFCFNVVDDRLPECGSPGLVEFELKKMLPEVQTIADVVTEVRSSLPVLTETCFFSDGIDVPVKTTKKGAKDGKGMVKVKSTSSGAKPIKDNDKIKLVCRPAGL
jgi:hypothetical protein